jgi:hypothetical protein
MWRLWLLDLGRLVLNPRQHLREQLLLILPKKKDEAEAEVEAEPRPEKEGVDLGKASPKDVTDTHVLPFPWQVKKHVEDEKFNHFVEVIQKMYVHIPMLDAIQVPTYAKYLKDILK